MSGASLRPISCNYGKIYSRNISKLLLVYRFCIDINLPIKYILQNITIYLFFCSFPHPESADVFAFLDYIEKYEKEEKARLRAQLEELKKEMRRRRQEARQNIRSRRRYKKTIKSLRNQYIVRKENIQKNHDEEVRRKYLMGREDAKYSRREDVP